MNSPLLIVGASVRAAAESAVQAGFQPFAIDLFNDLDLTRLADCRLSVNYPFDLPELANEFPPMPFVYTGALENYPDVIAQISQRHHLFGNPPETILKIRDPFQLRDILSTASFPTTDLLPDHESPQDVENWLIKPIPSGHGMQIRSATNSTAKPGEYYQRSIVGTSIGALFLSNGESCQLIGTHQHRTATYADPAQPFLFCGAHAPFDLLNQTTTAIRNVGELLVRETGLKGLFGCDLMISDDIPYLLEVNPRYTAAVELWEAVLQRPLLGDHIIACKEKKLPVLTHAIPSSVVSKTIYYASRKTQVPPDFENCLSKTEAVRLVDLPHTGTRIERGHPVCTLLANVNSAESGNLEQLVNAALDRLSQMLHQSAE